METEKLTNKEEEVMQVLWAMEKAFVKDMLPHFDDPPLHYNTLSTLIRKLEDKGYVAHRQYGNTYEYLPGYQQGRLSEPFRAQQSGE